jgi:hypothetical protein
MERETKLTAGDCCIILGKPWALEQGIRTAADMAAPAREEWATLAKRVVEARKSLKEAKTVVQESIAKHQPPAPAPRRRR